MILETLLWLTDSQLSRLWLDRQTMWNNEEIIKSINKILSIEEFAKQIPDKRSITWSTARIWWLVCTWIDDTTVWFNNWVTILSSADVSGIIHWYIRYSSPDKYNTFVVWDVVIPLKEEWLFDELETWNYRVYQLWWENARWIADLTDWALFIEKMVIENALSAKYIVPNNNKMFKKSDFNWANISVERVKAKVRPVVELMMKRNKEDAHKNYDEAMKNIIRATRELEASNNSANIDSYVNKIIDNISTSLTWLKESPMIKKIDDNWNFWYKVHTDILRCDGRDIWPYTLDINMLDWWVRIFNSWLHGSGRYNHPHVQPWWSVCWWTMATTVSEALRFWNLSLAVDACIWLITSLNPNSVYIWMEEFMRYIENSTWYKKYMQEEVFGKKIQEWKDKYSTIETRLADWAKEVFYGHQVYSITI